MVASKVAVKAAARGVRPTGPAVRMKAARAASEVQAKPGPGARAAGKTKTKTKTKTEARVLAKSGTEAGAEGRQKKGRPALTAQQQDLAAQYMPLAKALAKSLKRSWPRERDEFESAAMMALVEAAQSFDPTRNVKFATFARFRINGALMDVQRALVVAGYRGEDGAPKVASLPEYAEQYGRVFSATAGDPVGAETEAMDTLEDLLKSLPPRHAEACREIYAFNRSHGEAAERIGCSKSRISTLHEDSLVLLKEALINRGWRHGKPLVKN